MTSSRWKFKTKSLFQALFQKSIRTNCCIQLAPPLPSAGANLKWLCITFTSHSVLHMHSLICCNLSSQCGGPNVCASRSTLVWTAEPIWTKVRTWTVPCVLKTGYIYILYIYIYDVNSNQNQGCTSRKGSTLSAERSSNSASVQPGHHFPALGRAWLGSNKKTTRKQRSTKSCQAPSRGSLVLCSICTRFEAGPMGPNSNLRFQDFQTMC